LWQNEDSLTVEIDRVERRWAIRTEAKLVAEAERTLFATTIRLARPM
jgi:hypothetical protein